MRLTGFQQLWHACMHYWVGCLCSFKFLHPPQNPFLWVHSMGLINEYFSKGFGCCLFSFLYTPSRAEMRAMPRSELPSMLFITVQRLLLTLLWLTGNTLVIHFGWQAGIQLFLQKLICPVHSAFRIRIPEYNPNDHAADFENISASSQLLRSESIVSAHFSRVGICISKMPSRIGWGWRGWDCPLPLPEKTLWCCCLLLLLTWLPALRQRDGKWGQPWGLQPQTVSEKFP